jgi:hypothetical protein
MSNFSYSMYTYTISDIEANERDLRVAENRAQFVKGFKRAIKFSSLILILVNLCEISSAYAFEQGNGGNGVNGNERIEIQSKPSPPPGSNLPTTVAATEMLRKNRNLSIEAIIGFVVGVVIALLVADIVKSNKAFNTEQAQLEHLKEGVIKMSNLLDEKHKSFLKYGM